jgi:hypothetical protein
VAAGLVAAAVVVIVVARARGGDAYNLRFGTAFSDREGFAVIAGAVIATVMVAGVRWAAALLAAFAVLVVVAGVVHPCRIAFQDTPRPDRCSVSASASALGLYAPLAAVACLAARWAAWRSALSPPLAARLLGVSAAAVLVSLWLPWYRATDDGHAYTQTGWQVFQRLDVYLVVVAAAAGLLAVRVLRGRARRAARLGPAISLLALSAAGLVFYRCFTAADPPSGGYAPAVTMYVALGLLVAIALAALAATNAPRRGGYVAL